METAKTMTNDQIISFLANIPLFARLKKGHVEKLAKRCHELNYSPGETIVEQGKVGVGLFILVKGQVEVSRSHEDGTSIHLQNLEPPSFFGELSLLDDQPRTATVRAVPASTCLAINKLDFLDELNSDPEMAVEMLKDLASRFRRVVQQL